MSDSDSDYGPLAKVEDIDEEEVTMEEEEDEERFVIMERDVMQGVFMENQASQERLFGDDEDIGAVPRASFSFDGGALREDEQFCEVGSASSSSSLLANPPVYRSDWAERRTEESEEDQRRRSRAEAGLLYPPERAPPMVDFLTLLTAFMVAILAAYYSISN